jgi:hypothetical protein
MGVSGELEVGHHHGVVGHGLVDAGRGDSVIDGSGPGATIATAVTVCSSARETVQARLIVDGVVSVDA